MFTFYLYAVIGEPESIHTIYQKLLYGQCVYTQTIYDGNSQKKIRILFPLKEFLYWVCKHGFS
jgi:hypothetical protein